MTPSPIAADLLYRALAHGDIEDCDVLDLGCGTGILAVGAALLGARHVVGVDVDEAAVRVARQSATELKVDVELRSGRAEDVDEDFDVVVMNPPFGAQKALRGADLRFVRIALARAPIVYSLHLSKTRNHLLRQGSRLGARVSVEADYEFTIPHRFAFHEKESVIVHVDLLRWVRMG